MFSYNGFPGNLSQNSSKQDLTGQITERRLHIFFNPQDSSRVASVAPGQSGRKNGHDCLSMGGEAGQEVG